MKNKRNNFSAAFKASVACTALREDKTTNEIASENGIHTTQINKWRKILIEGSPELFERKNAKNKNSEPEISELQRIIGEQAIQLAWYKKKLRIAN